MTATSSIDLQPGGFESKAYQKLHPEVYLEQFLTEDVRPDGRDFQTWRAVSLNVGSITTANGSALIRMGNTTVICGVKAEIAEPDLNRPEEGFLVTNVDLPAMCSPRFKLGPPGDEAQVLSDRIDTTLKTSSVIPKTSLCIAAGKAVWTLYADVVCINYDGNVFDAALLAVVAALKNTRLPQAHFDHDVGETTCDVSVLNPLDLHCYPVGLTFGVFNSRHILSDPTSFEEPLLATSITIVVDENARVLSLTQAGPASKSGTSDVVRECFLVARKRGPDLIDLLKTT